MNWRTLLILLLLLPLVVSEPSGVTVISNETETPTPQGAAQLTTAGGSFTTLVLNATTQTLKWKAYVGNISGVLTLNDADNYTIYDWQLTSVSGEVYASRNSSINWGSMQCLQNSTLGAEEAGLNIATTSVDSINRTFNETVHQSFYVGTTLITNSNCRAIATYVDDSAQAVSENAVFQEVLLDDTESFVYTTILEDDVTGYNNETFDFQLIVAEDPTTSVPSPYYFWAELS